MAKPIARVKVDGCESRRCKVAEGRSLINGTERNMCIGLRVSVQLGGGEIEEKKLIAWPIRDSGSDKNVLGLNIRIYIAVRVNVLDGH
jgi:hypothetical protein